MIINDNNYATIGAVSGTISANLALSSAEISILSVSSTTPTTTFDVKLINRHGVEVYNAENITGKVLEHVKIPTSSNMTLTIYNASVDENFIYFIGAIERYA